MGTDDPRYNEGPVSGVTTVGGTVEPAGHAETEPRTGDTGLSIGIGQSTSTGFLPFQGNSNLDGTDTILDTDIDADPEMRTTTTNNSDTAIESLVNSDDGLLMDVGNPEQANVPEDDREAMFDQDEHRTIED